MNVYADEKFYTEEYLSGKDAVISSNHRYFFREASLMINQYTFGNIDPENIPQSVKMCCCELAESIFSRDRILSKNNGISSESVGGWSVNYASSSDVNSEFKKTVKNIIFKWFADADLLYRGVG